MATKNPFVQADISPSSDETWTYVKNNPVKVGVVTALAALGTVQVVRFLMSFRDGVQLSDLEELID